MAMKQKKRQDASLRFTLAVLVLCPLFSASFFFMPFKALAASFAAVSLLYAISLRPSPASFLCILRPALFYFAVLYAAVLIPSLAAGNLPSPAPYPLDMALAIACASLVCSAAYTVTTDLERREALDRAVPAIAPQLYLLSSFIPLVRRVWRKVDEARRSRGCRLVSVSMLVSFISVCMQKALGTDEAMRARELSA